MEKIDRWWMAVVSLRRTFTGTGAHCLRANAVSSGLSLTRRVTESTAKFSREMGIVAKPTCESASNFDPTPTEP
jgi:hypothetical protein